jgi:hypothetical protein
MTQKEIEALMNGIDIERDFGSEEFEKLINEAHKYTSKSISATDPENMVLDLELILKNEEDNIKKRAKKFLKLRDATNKVKKYVDEIPELFL